MSEIPKNNFLFIIGARKAGTSFLFSQLAQLKEICPIRDKEPHFFTLHFEDGKYDQLWNFDSAAHTYAMEASTSYSMYPQCKDVPQKIKDYGITPHLIYILRNPYDRLESDLNFDRGKNWDNPIRGFKDPNAFNRSMYFKQLEEYRKVFPSIKPILICFEELKKNPEAAVEKVREQLGLEKIELQFKEEEKHTTAVPTKAQDIAHKFSSIRKLALLLPTPIRKMINDSPFLGKRTKRTLTETERQYFHELWKDDMQNLKDHYGFNVSQWGF